MGRLYQRTVSGETTLARFESGRVLGGKSTADIIVCYNNAGQIYKRAADGGDFIAICDSGGNLRKTIYGLIIAKCEDGIIYEGESAGGRVLARYDGDMYGAAAALAALILNWI